MNIKDRIYQIVADKSLSVDEKYAKIQELLHGKGNGAGSSSGGTGEGGGGGEGASSSSSSSNSSDSDSGEGSGEGQDGGSNGGQQNQGKGQGSDGQNGENGSDEEGNGESGDEGANGKDGQGSGKGNSGDSTDGQNGQGGGESDEDGSDLQDGQGSGKGNSGKQQGQKGQGGEQGEGGEGDSDGSDSQNGQGQGNNSQNQQGGQQGQQAGGQGSQNQQNAQNQQGKQNSQNQNGQQGQQGQGKQDPEDYLKDLDLGKKQQYKKAKGDGSDDPIVNGLPPGEVIDDNDDDQQGGFGGQMPEEFDDYKAGRYIGIAYAKEVFKGRGVKPTYGYIYDIPDVEEMRLIESMLMESDTDIRDILSGGGDDGSKAEAIYKLLFPDNSELNAPEDLIMMRNGDVSLDDWGNDNHIISKELGDEIKKEIEEMPNSVDQDIKEIDPEWGSNGSEGEVQERMKYIKKLLDLNYIQDKFKREVAKKMIEKFGQRIEKNSEGVVDWKRSLEDFMYDASHHREDGRIKKNLYTFSGIGARHKRRVYDNIGKIVIYADTSGSAYSFCSTMISEVSKMARDCDISEFDIHLFTDTVYAEHFGIDSETVQDEDFGFEDVNSGGTSLNNVYNHIIENYIDGYELTDDVSAIIIMTDVDGIEDSGRIDNSEYFKKNMDQILYLIFDPAETTQRALAKLMPKGAKYIAITPRMLNGTGYNESVRSEGSSLLEAISRNTDDVKSTLNRQNDDDEKRRAYMKRANVGAMRDLGRLDQLVPEIFKAFEENLPLFRYVKNVDYFEDTEATFYIDDDLRIWVHGNFKNSDILPQFLNLCNTVKVYKFLGDIDIKNNRSLKSLPDGFPEILEGNLYMYNLPSLESLDNLPKRMNGYYINIHDSRRHKNELISQAEKLGVKVVVDEISRSTVKSLFDKSNESENMQMNEAIGRKLTDVKKQLNKTEVDDEQKKEYLRKTNIRAMRDLGRMDQLVPEIFSAMNDIMPEVSIVKSVDYFEDTENTFYIDDDLRLWIHKDFDTKDEMNKLLALSSIVDVFMVIGRVCVVNNTTMKEFPAGFPKEIKGYFKMQNLFNLKNFNNAPRVIYGDESPAIEPKSRWIRPSDINTYKESLRDKQNNAIDVFDLLRNTKTNESMNNRLKESEIAKRVALGQQFMNEAFPKPLSPLFRQSIPQEPRYPDMPDAPNPDDYSDDEEGQRRLASAQKRYDAIKAKRERGVQRYEDSVKDYNERLRPLYRKNAEIFHDVITPIIDADWGDIKDSDVKTIKGFTEIHSDIKNNNKKFSGIKLFTDDNNVISLVYAKPMDSYYSRIVYFRDADGSAITNENEINDRIKERDNIFRQANDIFVKQLNFKWDDLPQQKRSGETPNIEEVMLNFLYWSFAKLNGSEKGGKQFNVDDVVYNPHGLSYSDLLDDYMNVIFYDPQRKNDNAFNIRGIGTVNFNADRQQGPGNCLNFIKCARNANKNNKDFNPAEMLTDDVLRSLLLGLVVRAEYDGKKIYTADEVINADRSELVSMVYEVLDFDIYKSSLTYMSYKYKDSEISKSDYLENPQSVLLLFPDVCRIEYIISADIKDSVLDNYEKRAQRQVNRAGMSSTIKKFDYDYRTGDRKRNDIVGNTKKTNVEATALDQFEHYAEYFKDTKLDAINDIVRSTLNGRNVYKRYTEAIANIKGYPDLIVSFIKNNPEMENEDKIMMLIEYYTAIEDSLETIWKNNGKDENEIENATNDIIINAESIAKAYNNITGNSDKRKTSALSKIITRADRRGNIQAVSKGAEKKEYDSTAFQNMVDAASKDYVTVKRILNTLDFANADEGAIEDFGSKDNMIRIITNHVDGALSFGRALLGANDGDKMKSMEASFKELSQILNDIVNFNDELDNSDAVISKTLNDDLKKLARTISSEGKKYSAAGSQGAAVAV